jgi:hypothetical protein
MSAPRALATFSRTIHFLFITTIISQTTVYASTLIPVPARRDHVFDDARNTLYITTSAGSVERYDLTTNSLLTPFSVASTSFNGIDVSLDGQFIYVADATQGATQGVFRKFNTETGERTNLFYNRAGGEGEAWDIAVTNAGHAIVTTDYNGSGGTPMRRIDLTTDVFSTEIRPVRQRTHLHRSKSGNLVFYLQSNISSGPIGVYDPATMTFPSTFDTGSSNSGKLGAVNRDGTLIAIESGGGISILNKSLSTVEILGGLQGGIGFNPAFDTFYGVDVNSDQVVAFNTNNFAEIARYSVGENVVDASEFSNGIISFSGNGKFLFLSTTSGVRMLDVTPVPELGAWTLISAGALTLASRRGALARLLRLPGQR